MTHADANAMTTPSATSGVAAEHDELASDIVADGGKLSSASSGKLESGGVRGDADSMLATHS